MRVGDILVSEAAQRLQELASRPAVPGDSQAVRHEYAMQGTLQKRIAHVIAHWTGPNNEIDRIRDEMAAGLLGDVLDAARTGPRAPTLYRSMYPHWRKFNFTGLLAGLKAGDHLELAGLSSFTSDRRCAAKYSRSGESSILLKVKDAQGLCVAGISNSPEEQEWLVTGFLQVIDVNRRVETLPNHKTTTHVRVECEWRP